jgi:hypothetical protein
MSNFYTSSQRSDKNNLKVLLHVYNNKKSSEIWFCCTSHFIYLALLDRSLRQIVLKIDNTMSLVILKLF